MRIVVTGANGFVARNLRLRLRERGYDDVFAVTRETGDETLHEALERADFVYHLAGVNRPADPGEFESGNADLTRRLCEALARAGRGATIVFASSTQAALDNAYGRSKRAAE